MTVTFTSGNLFDSQMATWVNTVNCVGVMGKGIALAFGRRFRDMRQDYERRCEAGEVVPGLPYIVETGELLPRSVINFPTKQHWRGKSRLEWITTGLDHLEARYQRWEVESLAVPPLGCGHGGLRWEDVKPELEERFARFDIPVEVFEPERLDIYDPLADTP